MKRLTGRRTCSKTGAVLNIYFSSPAELEACKKAGGELLQRKDDNEETIGNRLKVYQRETAPLIDLYTKRVEAICARHGVAIAAAALQFPLAHRAVASVVTGMRNRREVESNLAHCRARIPGDCWAELKREGLIAADAPVPAST